MVDEIRKRYIVVDADQHFAEQRKDGGSPANAVRGWVYAIDENNARDTAKTVMQDRRVFVRDWDSAEDEFVAAAEKMGPLNTSPAHLH